VGALNRGGHYHLALKLEAPLDWKLTDKPAKYVREWPRAARASAYQKLKCAKAVEKALGPLVMEAERLNDLATAAPTQGADIETAAGPSLNGRLEQLQQRVMEAIRSAAQRTLRKRAPPGLVPTEQLRRAMTLTFRVRTMLTQADSPIPHAAARRLANALQGASLCPTKRGHIHPPADLVTAWDTWRRKVGVILHHGRPTIDGHPIIAEAEKLRRWCRRIWWLQCRTRGPAMDPLEQEYSEGPRGRGKALRAMSEGVNMGGLDSAVDHRGSLQTDPKIYMPLAADIVAKPMSLGVDVDLRTGRLTGLRGPKRHRLPWVHRSPHSESIIVKGRLPAWWATAYDPSSVPGARGRFDQILAGATVGEVWREVRKSKGGTSPGHDEVDMDLWKLIVDYRVLRGQVDSALPVEDDPPATRALRTLTALVNTTWALAIVTPFAKLGLITMVPKTLSDGSMSNTPDKMRPITVLPAFHRIASRIVNSRILLVLLQNPTILHWSQRAFIRNGSTDQCIDMTQDAIEEANEGRIPVARCDYDQRKAYDSVQAYSVRAALQRLSFPPPFVEYVMSSLDGALSKIRTWHGFTSVRVMYSGLRQGDPLSPILYNIVIDVLSVRMDEHGAGFVFRHSRLTLTNCKFADDIMAISMEATPRQNPQGMVGIHLSHQIIRSFCGAHCWDLNTAKSFFTTSWDPNTILPP
jgi:hypothetical protein